MFKEEELKMEQDRQRRATMVTGEKRSRLMRGD